ncbi:MAG TPA: hypothetical protein VGO21_03640 [Candidatus Paceibacterota bacterium]|jgi:hypothetical protein|nr:hypothetical protein [Candidatus Paceibacterota bacterium]
MPESLNLSGDPPSPEEIEKRKVEARRGAIKRIGIGAVGAAALLAGGMTFLKEGINTETSQQKRAREEREQDEKDNEELPPREIIEDPHEYKSGDYINTPAGAVELQGWRVAMGDVAVSGMSYFAVSGAKNYTLKFRSPEDGKSWTVFTSGEGEEVNFPPYQTLDIRGLYENQKTFYLLPNLRNPVIVLEVSEFPGDKAPIEQEIFAEKEDIKKIRRKHKKQASKMHRYRIRLHGSINSPKNNENIPRVFAEGKIPRAELDKVADIHRLAGAFRPVAPVYVYGESDNDPYWQAVKSDQHFDPSYNRVALSYHEFMHPDVPGQAQQIAFHEICHSIMQGAKLEGPQDVAYKKMSEGFSNIRQQANPNREELWNDPAFVIFREFSYYKTKPNAKKVLPAGHPWDNANELFASALTVFRYYSKEFMERLERFDPPTKAIVIQQIQNIFGLLRSMNSDPEVLKRFIPNIDNFKKIIGE